MTIKRAFVAIAVSAVTFGGVAVAPSSGAISASVGAKYYSSCAKLTKKYPNGVARNAASARRAVRQGFYRPSTTKAAKKTYRENSSRLDRDGDGVACES
jgi:hypothetical protein